MPSWRNSSPRPSASDIAREIGSDVDPDAIHAALKLLSSTIGRERAADFRQLHETLASDAPYSPDAASAGARSLRSAALLYLCEGDPEEGGALALAQFHGARNMTDRLSAMAGLARVQGPRFAEALQAFEAAYRDDPLALDKWFAIQATAAARTTLDNVKGLLKHPAFSLRTPNRVYALLSSFAHANPTEFHRPDGAGYAFVADLVLTLDGINPQVAARLVSGFRTWKTLEARRQNLARLELKRISAQEGLSRDVGDIVDRALA